MQTFLTPELLKKILDQKNRLVTLTPELAHFFVDIHFPCENSEEKLSLPFLPIRCFRDFYLHKTPSNPEHVVFLSSGSTNEQRAKHVFTHERLKLYAEQSCHGFTKFLNSHHLKRNIPIISLIPEKEFWPQSSLAAMIFMFKENGFHIHYCDIEKSETNIIELLKNKVFSSEALIFGTTFHHLLISAYVEKNNLEKIFKGKKLALVDTGGTKGRTQSISITESKERFRKAYGVDSESEFLFLSEYGMCELASQAWSTQKSHDGTFFCNETLLPVCLDLKKNIILKEGEEGFLGFIDTVNLDSWPTIITEDIATVVNQNEIIFKLKGRAPDASLKGCSLNVKKNFFFGLSSQKPADASLALRSASSRPRAAAASALARAASPEQVFENLREITQALLKSLNTKIWGPKSRADLAESLASWNDDVQDPNKLTGENILIISSANIPIAWLYPARIAALLGAKSIHIKLPSLRPEDPFAVSVRIKSEELIKKIKPYIAPTEIILEQSQNIENNFSRFSSVIVFGTKETIDVFSEKLSGTKTRLIAQGPIQNSLTITQNESPEEIAQLCSRWLGRGCLTPVCLFLRNFNAEQKRIWRKEFHASFETNFFERIKEEEKSANVSEKYLHTHNILYTKSLLKIFKLEPENIIFTEQFTHIVDLSQLNKQHPLCHKIDFSFGGGGFIYILDESIKHLFPQLSSYNVQPALSEKHGEKTWEDWISN